MTAAPRAGRAGRVAGRRGAGSAGHDHQGKVRRRARDRPQHPAAGGDDVAGRARSGRRPPRVPHDRYASALGKARSTRAEPHVGQRLEPAAPPPPGVSWSRLLPATSRAATARTCGAHPPGLPRRPSPVRSRTLASARAPSRRRQQAIIAIVAASTTRRRLPVRAATSRRRARRCPGRCWPADMSTREFAAGRAPILRRSSPIGRRRPIGPSNCTSCSSSTPNRPATRRRGPRPSARPHRPRCPTGVLDEVGVHRRDPGAADGETPSGRTPPAAARRAVAVGVLPHAAERAHLGRLRLAAAALHGRDGGTDPAPGARGRSRSTARDTTSPAATFERR